MFGNLGFGEMVLIALVVLLLFGPDKLPQLLRQVGRTMAEIRQAAERAQAVIREEWARVGMESGWDLDAPPSEAAETTETAGSAEASSAPTRETAGEPGPEVTVDDPEGRR
jgi:sec-independent protein translocase protein TatB